MDIDGVRTFSDFGVIEIVDDSFPYPALLGIDWAFNNSTLVDLKKRHMKVQMKVHDTQSPSDKKMIHTNWKTYTN